MNVVTMLSKWTSRLCLLVIGLAFSVWILATLPRPQMSLEVLTQLRLPGTPSRICSTIAVEQWAAAVPGFGIIEFQQQGVIRNKLATPGFSSSSLGVTPDGSRLIGDDNGLIVKWEIDAESPSWFTADFSRVFDLLVVPDRHSFIASGDDGQTDLGMGGSIHECDITTGVIKRTLYHSDHTTPWWLSSDAKHSLVACLLHDGTALVIDLEAGRPTCSLKRPKNGSVEPLAKGCEVSSDGKLLAICGEGGVDVWEIASERLVNRMYASGKTLNRIRFANGMNAILCLSDTDVSAWSLTNGRVVATMSVSGATGHFMSHISDTGLACLTLRDGVLIFRVSTK